MKVVVEEFHRAVVKFDDLTIGNCLRSQLQLTVTSSTDSIALKPQNSQTVTKSNIYPIGISAFPSLKADNSTTVPVMQTVRSEDFSPHQRKD
ncbi:hypothetical protein [Microcoleus sp. bin38.metabat.b11b12b14.051]|uniref:hypothetical protein n=1 Tax=Microcoleus sp. bin38.metabat.b11b12b14.051 TaxID=2742709 RepID=UPI0025CCE212|nr:hypothetical protein [Microcoleus sp. bin38.metabat.b11b12b14.051]